MSLRINLGLGLSLLAATIGYSKAAADNKPALTKSANSPLPVVPYHNLLIFPQQENSFSEQEIKKTIKDLDSHLFRVREYATKKLKTLTDSLQGNQFVTLFSIMLNEIKNPSSLESQRRLEMLIDSISSKKYAEVIIDKNTSKFVIEEIAKRQGSDLLIRTALLRGENVPEKIIKEILDQEHLEIKEDIADSNNVSKEVLIALSKDDDNWVREGVAENSNTPKEVLTILSNDPSKAVRDRAVMNLNASIETLIFLAQDQSLRRRILKSNSNITNEFLERLIEQDLRQLNQSEDPAQMWPYVRAHIFPLYLRMK